MHTYHLVNKKFFVIALLWIVTTICAVMGNLLAIIINNEFKMYGNFVLCILPYMLPNLEYLLA